MESQNLSLVLKVFIFMMIIRSSKSQIISFQMVANGKTNACLTEWFGEDETLAVTFNMDEHLTNVLRRVGKDRDAQEKAIVKLSKNIMIKIIGNNDEVLKEFSNMMSGSFSYVTENYQAIKICVFNSMKKPVIIGKFYSDDCVIFRFSNNKWILKW